MHHLIEEAAAGRLPSWSNANARRQEHIARVAALLDEWAVKANLGDDDRRRWRAAGTLHDALHDAPEEELRPLMPSDLRDAPAKMLHGPACVTRLRAEGVDDEELLHAIMYHTIGHPRFGDIGHALYAADYLEPGRQQEPLQRAGLRALMPAAIDRVVPAILKARISENISRGLSLRPETVAFWNSIPDERRA